MTYMLVKLAVLFILVSLIAFLIGRWMIKRSSVAASDNDESSLDAPDHFDDEQWRRLWRRLDETRQAPETDADVPVTSQAAPVSAVRIESATLAAIPHGEKDELSRIWGIGPHLEDRLNKNGIFYFWQIADWTHQDIQQIDDRLDTFKGRIVRDSWVSQAALFSAEPGSARRLATTRKSA